MKRKILYLTYHSEIGGGETVLLGLFNSLNKKRFVPHAVLAKKGGFSKSLIRYKIPTHIIPMPGYLSQTFFVPGMSVIGLWELYNLVQKVNPSIIHVNHLNLVVYAGIVGKLLNIPVVATAHGPWDSYYFFQDLATNIFTDMVFANTPDVEKALLKKGMIPKRKVKTVLFGIDTDKFSPVKNKGTAKRSFGLKPSDIVITWAGRFDPVKDPLAFFKAANIVNKSYPNVSFLAVGSDTGDFSTTNDKSVYRSIKKYLSKNSDLSKKVIFKGFIDYEEMPSVYKATDIFVSSSHSESFGLALAEAQSTGVPVVATDKGGQHLIVKDGITGYLVPPKNPKKLAEKILKLIKSENLRYDFGIKGRANIEKNFSMETYTRNVEGVYLNIIRKSS